MSTDGPAILIVDDLEENRYTLGRRLKREGYGNLQFAENGQEAIERLRSQPFDLVLLDIMMPVMNGYDALTTIKSDAELNDVPVIVISAVNEMDSVVRCIEAGAEDYLPKPFNAALLRARVGASLAKKQLHDQEVHYRRLIEAERQRIDDLLHATLPAAAVRELKSTDTVRPRRFENVAVVFCDIVGFTSFCDSRPPEEVVVCLEQLVESFERITAKHGLEKIKTIGDAFMATGGLLEPLDNPALASTRCAMEMVTSADSVCADWQVRAGVHMGPVVAGVIGRQKYGFDLWGDTVNVAARIMEVAEAGQVLVSGEMWPLLDGYCQGESIGTVELKGKGRLELIHCRDASASQV